MIVNSILLLAIISFIIYYKRKDIYNWLVEDDIKKELILESKKHILLNKIKQLKEEEKRLLEIERYKEEELLDLNNQILELKKYHIDQSNKQKEKQIYIDEIHEFFKTY